MAFALLFSLRMHQARSEGIWPSECNNRMLPVQTSAVALPRRHKTSKWKPHHVSMAGLSYSRISI